MYLLTVRYEISKSVTECLVGVAETSCICFTTLPGSCVEHFKGIVLAGAIEHLCDFKA